MGLVADAGLTVRIKSLSQKAGSTVSDEGAGQMQHAEIVLALLLPADEEPAEAVQPTVRSFDDPASGSVAHLSRQPLGLFTAWAQVQRVEELLGQLPHLVIVVTFVQRQSLRLLGSGFRPGNRHALQGFTRQAEVGPIGTGHGHSQRHTRPVGQQGALRAALGAVGGIGTGFSPHPTALWSSPRRVPATPTQSLVVARKPANHASRVRGTAPPPSTPGSGDGRSSS